MTFAAACSKPDYRVLSSETYGFENTYELGTASTWKKTGTNKLRAPWKQHTFYAPVHSSTLESIPERRQWFKSGWRVGASSAATLATLSFIINLAATIFISRRFKLVSGIASIYTGDCTVVENYDTWIHLAINAISTALLSGSNYCMQVLCAPNRQEVDKAHSQKKYTDIGIPSIRNLKLVRKGKLLLWCLLGLSSVPLHLMYNSMFFGSLSTNNYNIYYAREEVLTGADYDHDAFPDQIAEYNDRFFDTSLTQKSVQQNASSWQKLSNEECIAAYAVDMLSSRRDVIVVHGNFSQGSLSGRDQYVFDIYGDLVTDDYDPYEWICYDRSVLTQDSYSLIPSLKATADQWAPHGYDVQYCMSEIVEGKCTLNFSLAIAIVIMICNVVKVCCMSYVAWGIRDKPLITVGDAVASFLRRRDATTEGACMVTNEYFIRNWSGDYDSGLYAKETLGQEPKTFHRERQRLRGAASKGRWFGLVGLFSLALIVIAGLLAYGIAHLKTTNKSASALWTLGFGTVREESLVGGTGWHVPSITAAVLVANLPQAILSFLYLLFNGVLTAMLISHEWSHYAYQRKPLRVSTPKGTQRSTYFLSLPYRFAFPLMALSVILHWLVSQSLSLANITIEQRDGSVDPKATVSTCGYSPMAMVLTLRWRMYARLHIRLWILEAENRHSTGR